MLISSETLHQITSALTFLINWVSRNQKIFGINYANQIKHASFRGREHISVKQQVFILSFILAQLWKKPGIESTRLYMKSLFPKPRKRHVKKK